MFDPRAPTLKRNLVEGHPLGVFWFSLGSVALIEAAVAAGAEAIVIDMQHGLFDRTTLEAAIGAVPAGVPCLVRVEDDTATAIGRALDAGAEGIIVPLVETGEQARKAAAACHYAPKGHRSGGGVRPLRDFRAYMGAASQAITVGVMIETKAGVDNAEAIAAAGLSTTEILEVDDLVRGNAMFAATAITGGTLGLSAPRRSGGWNLTHSLIVRPGSVRRIVESRPVTDQE